MRRPGYAAFLREGEEECLVCSHHNQRDTQKLLTEHKIPLRSEWIQSGWTTPYLIYATVRREDLAIQSPPEYPQIIRKLKNLRDVHKKHLDEQSQVDDSAESFWEVGEDLSRFSLLCVEPEVIEEASIDEEAIEDEEEMEEEDVDELEDD